MTKKRRRKNGTGGRTRIKIAVSLPTEQVEAAERAVSEGRVASVSAYVARALEKQVRADTLGELIATMRAEDGPPSADDYAWADAALATIVAPKKTRAAS